MTNEEKKKTVIEWLLGSGLAVALIVNGFQYKQNIDLQRMNVQIQKISEFRESGSAMDKAVIAAFDSLAGGQFTEKDRKNLQESYIEHVLKTEEKREFLGAESTERYLQALNVLKSRVDSAEDARGAGPRVEALAEVIKLRREMSEQAMAL